MSSSLIFMLFSFYLEAVIALGLLRVMEELSPKFSPSSGLGLDFSVFQVRSVLSTRYCPFLIKEEGRIA